MQMYIALFFIFALIAHADDGACTNETYGTVENGKYGYAACDITMDGYKSALCTDGTFGTDDTSKCVVREVTIFSYGIETVSYKVGEVVSAISLKTDGQFTSYAISPALPQGMTFDSTTGVIAGTPSVASSQATYTITGTPSTSGAEASTTTISITVNAIVCAAFDSFPETANGQIATSTTACPTGYHGTAKRTCTNGHFGDLDTTSCSQNGPSDLHYTQTSISVNRLEHVMVTPSCSGTVNSYSISPSLPTGITINQTTGVISGIPTVVSTQRPYTVTATGPSGTTSATVTISLTVNNAKCSGLTDKTSSAPTKNHNDQITFDCDEGYLGNWSYTCDNGVYKNKNTDTCYPKKPTGFSYAQGDYSVILGETINTGIPTISGIVSYYEATLPEGFTIDRDTGIITGSSEVPVDEYVTVTAVASDTYMQKATCTVHIVVSDVTCEATEDFKTAQKGESSSYKCPEGYKEGSMKRKCKNINNKGVFDLPDAHCQKEQDYTFVIVCAAILVVCLIFLFIGCCVNSSRKRSKDKKSLAKTTKPAAPKPVAKAAPKKVQKVTI